VQTARNYANLLSYRPIPDLRLRPWVPTELSPVVMDDVIASLTGFSGLPIPGGVCEVDGTIIGMNLAAERLFGRTAAEVMGKKAWDMAPGAEHIWDDVLATARKQGTFRGEISIATPREPRPIYYVVTHRELAGKGYVLVFALDLPDA
jgi:PAS domain S-box-containing protein